MPISRFEDIESWQLARGLAMLVFQVSAEGGFSKDFPLRDQINRAAGSIMDNIAKGFDGGTNGEFARFLTYAQRSCTEVQSQLYRALDRQYLDQPQFDELYAMAVQTRSKIGAFIKYLKKSDRR